jgi:methyl-accepting chemotaxis protein
VTEEAGGLMMEIIPEIEKTAKLVQEISAASLEQSSGSEQVNNALQQLSQVTQQNAAASEEMATSSEELASQADQLKEIVNFFKIDDNENKVVRNASLQQFKPEVKSSKQTLTNGVVNKNAAVVKGVDINLGNSNNIDNEFESY